MILDRVFNLLEMSSNSRLSRERFGLIDVGNILADVLSLCILYIVHMIA